MWINQSLCYETKTFQMSLNPDGTDLDKTAIERKVVASMNEKFGSDLANLSGLDEMHASLLSQLQALDSRLDLASSSAPNQLQKALRHVMKNVK